MSIYVNVMREKKKIPVTLSQTYFLKSVKRIIQWNNIQVNLPKKSVSMSVGQRNWQT